VFIQGVKRPERFSIVGSVVNKVIRPDMDSILWPKSNTRSIIQPEPPFFRMFHWHFEPFTPPQALDTLVVHPPSRISQQSRDATITVSAVLASQFDHVGNQAIFIGATFWSFTLC
jgi:hypothetical protein